MNQKIVAIFLATIMVVSILPFLFGGSSQTPNTQDEQFTQVSFDAIPGTKVDHEFNSISDALEMTPEGVTSAQYIDIQRASGTPLAFVVGNTTQMNSIYNTQMTKRYVASSTDTQTGFELHEISPEVVAFQHAQTGTYKEYQLLSRYGGVYNVVGSPMVFGQRTVVEDVIDVLSGDAQGNDEFDKILSYTDASAEFQLISSESPEVAEQYYLEFKKVSDIKYSRTMVYLNPTEGTMENVTAFADNSTERGLVYDTTVDEDVTKVVITSDIYTLLSEPSW